MQLMLNGQYYEFSGTTLEQLLTELQLAGRKLAVEVNRDIVPRSQHHAYRLNEGDMIEIVHAIGGG